jgi:hypothetical protein
MTWVNWTGTAVRPGAAGLIQVKEVKAAGTGAMARAQGRREAAIRRRMAAGA